MCRDYVSEKIDAKATVFSPFINPNFIPLLSIFIDEIAFIFYILSNANVNNISVTQIKYTIFNY